MLGGVKIDLEGNWPTSWNVCTDYNFCQPMLSSCLVHIKTFPFACSPVELAVSSVQSKGSLRQLCTTTALLHISTYAGTSNCYLVHEQFATGCRLLTVNLATRNSLSKPLPRRLVESTLGHIKCVLCKLTRWKSRNI